VRTEPPRHGEPGPTAAKTKDTEVYFERPPIAP
jgi:hypothetical protein